MKFFEARQWLPRHLTPWTYLTDLPLRLCSSLSRNCIPQQTTCLERKKKFLNSPKNKICKSYISKWDVIFDKIISVVTSLECRSMLNRNVISFNRKDCIFDRCYMVLVLQQSYGHKDLQQVLYEGHFLSTIEECDIDQVQ